MRSNTSNFLIPVWSAARPSLGMVAEPDRSAAYKILPSPGVAAELDREAARYESRTWR